MHSKAHVILATPLVVLAFACSGDREASETTSSTSEAVGFGFIDSSDHYNYVGGLLKAGQTGNPYGSTVLVAQKVRVHAIVG